MTISISRFTFQPGIPKECSNRFISLKLPQKQFQPFIVYFYEFSINSSYKTAGSLKIPNILELHKHRLLTMTILLMQPSFCILINPSH